MEPRSTPDPADARVTAAEAAKILGVSHATICRWMDAGKIPGERLPSGRRVIRRADLDNVYTPIVPTTAGTG